VAGQRQVGCNGTYVLKEDLEHTAGLLVDEARDTLHTATTSEAADGGLGDALDVVAKNLAVTLSAALAETLAALSTSRHVVVVGVGGCGGGGVCVGRLAGVK
jgi:DNA-binding MurR/RpiR family transcriptional regulator